MDYRIGYSLAGKDKGVIYYICSCDSKNYWLSDGNRFTLENPKKKNKKHLQIIKKYSICELLHITNVEDISNEMIKTLLNIIYEDIQEVK